MTDDRLVAALGRLDRALGRLEAGAEGAAKNADLAERHARLRTAAEEAVAMLDELIAAR